MNKNGEIIIVDDDTDDTEILAEVYNGLPYINKLKVFHSGEQAYQYISDTNAHPFLIISDINMPKMNGFELRKRILSDAKLSGKVIPFIFHSTGVDRSMMKEHCQHNFHGYFEKL